MTATATEQPSATVDLAPARPKRTGARLLIYGVLIVAAVATLLPFAWVLTGSLRSTADIRADPGAWLPSSITFDNFVRLFEGQGFGVYLFNSLVIAAVTVVGNLVCASLLGYALGKLDFRGKNVVFVAVLVSLMMPFSATFVPQFVVTVHLGLINTLGGIALPAVVLPISIFIMRQFASTIPDELFEAARIDGASELRIFLRIFLPLAGPALATQTIMSFLASWNSFIWPLIVAQDQSDYTLPVGLAAASTAVNTTDYGLLLAGAVVVMLPVFVLFLFLQRYFVQGIAAAGLK